MKPPAAAPAAIAAVFGLWNDGVGMGDAVVEGDAVEVDEAVARFCTTGVYL
jgi:hypothetical protein